MKSRSLLLALGLLLTAGCGGDTFGTIFHESIATYNEMADNMVFVCDEDTAEAFAKMRMDKLGKRWQAITAKAQAYMKANDATEDPKVRYELADAFIDYSDEYVGVMDRLKDEVNRLDQIRIKIYLQTHPAFKDVADLDIECPQITKVMNAPNNLQFKSLLPDNPFDIAIVMGKWDNAAPMAQPGIPAFVPGFTIPGMQKTQGGGMPGMMKMPGMP